MTINLFACGITLLLRGVPFQRITHYRAHLWLDVHSLEIEVISVDAKVFCPVTSMKCVSIGTKLNICAVKNISSLD